MHCTTIVTAEEEVLPIFTLCSLLFLGKACFDIGKLLGKDT